MWLHSQPNPGAEADCLPPVGPEARVKERAGRNTLSLIVQMSSGRLSLDRVGRHHCPSPFHRHGQINTHSPIRAGKGDISTLHGLGTFLLCVDNALYRVDYANAFLYTHGTGGIGNAKATGSVELTTGRSSCLGLRRQDDADHGREVLAY